MVLFWEQPAGTADSPTGILEETRDYYKIECCTTHTTMESMNFFCLFTGKKSIVSSSTQNKLLIRLSLLIQKWAIRYCCFPLQKMSNWSKVFWYCEFRIFSKRICWWENSEGLTFIMFHPVAVVDIEDIWQVAYFRSCWKLRNLMKGPEISFGVNMEKLEN